MAIENVEVIGGFGEIPNVQFSGDAPAGLEVHVLEEGSGEEVKVGDTIEVNYHGVVWGGDIFDSSFQRGSSIEFPIGVGMLIKAWDQGIIGHKVGSRLVISAEPDFAYGEQGVPGSPIGPNSVLTFVVDVISIKK